MNWLSLQTIAQVSVERVLNALPAGLLIALFAWGVLRIFRRQNSGTRFAVWFLALVTVVALPVLSGFTESYAKLMAGMASWSAASWGSMRPAINIPAGWAQLAFLTWALGASVAIARLAHGLWRLRQLRRSCTAIHLAELDPKVRATVAAISASGSVTVTRSEMMRVPSAIGFWNRTIVLPAWALRELAPDDLNVILLHEFAHLRRWDDWTNLIQKIVRALFFFHPAVWWIDTRLSVEREMACDDAVIAQTSNPQSYARCLVSLLEKSLAHRLSRPQGWSMVQAAVHRAHEATLRLAQILDKNRPVATRVWRPALGIVGIFSVLCLVVAPNAPQLVAFDQVRPIHDAGAFYSSSVSPASPVAHLASFHPAFESLNQPIAVVPAKFQADAQTKKSPSASLAGAKPSAKPSAFRMMWTSGSERRDIRRKYALRATVNSDINSLTPQRVALTGSSADDDRPVGGWFKTVVFVEQVRYNVVDPQMSTLQVWKVQVWRVMLVGPARGRGAAPVIDSI
jgi:beta-lactamase regulating signal transducer with metallopeptidase domain